MTEAWGEGHGAARGDLVGAIVDELAQCRFLDEGTSRRTVGEYLGLPSELCEGTLPAFRVEVARHVSLEPIGRVVTLCTVVGWYDEPRRESLWRRLQPLLATQQSAGLNHHQPQSPPSGDSSGTKPGAQLRWLTNGIDGREPGAGETTPETVAPQAAPMSPPLPGPFTADERRRVEELLMAERFGPQDMHELRDNIGFELGFPVPDEPSTPLDLFAALVDFNAFPDRVLPSVVAVEWVAARTPDDTTARRYSEWTERWARAHDCLPELLRRRQARTSWQADPRVPRALLIMVEPAADGSEDITVRYWINDLAGQWAPRAGEATEISMQRLNAAVEQALAHGERLWATSRTDPAEQLLPFVEFILPYRLLNHDVARLEIDSGGPGAAAIGPRYCVHLRSLDRLRRVPVDPFMANRWRQRWHELHQHGARLHHWTDSDAVPMDRWSRALTHRQHGSAPYTAVALDAPERGTASLTALKRAVAEGFGLILWDRRGGLEPRSRETIAELLDGTRAAHGVPRRVQEMRARAEADPDGDAFLGRHVACVWDDPDRVVDCQPGRAGPDLPPDPPDPPDQAPPDSGPNGPTESPDDSHARRGLSRSYGSPNAEEAH